MGFMGGAFLKRAGCKEARSAMGMLSEYCCATNCVGTAEGD